MVLAFLNADLQNVGPTKQTLNIILNTNLIKKIIVITLFKEPKNSLIKLFLEKNIKIVSLNLSRKFFFLNGTYALEKQILANKVTHLHSFGVKPDILAHYVCKKLNLKHIITLRNFPMEDLPTRMNPFLGFFTALLHLNILKKNKNLIACSRTIALKMSESYKLTNKIHYIQNGVDTDIYKPVSFNSKINLRKKLNLPTNKHLFICTNSFIPRKHNDLVISAFIQSSVENSELLMLGSGSLFEKLKQKYKNHTTVKFLGHVENVLEYLQCSDNFISASDSEGLPNAVLEAISCNLSVILSDIPQHKEVLDELPEYGIIFPVNDTKNLIKLIQNSTICPIKSLDASNKFSLSPFTMKKMGEKYKEYYKRMD